MVSKDKDDTAPGTCWEQSAPAPQMWSRPNGRGQGLHSSCGMETRWETHWKTAPFLLWWSLVYFFFLSLRVTSTSVENPFLSCARFHILRTTKGHFSFMSRHKKRKKYKHLVAGELLWNLVHSCWCPGLPPFYIWPGNDPHFNPFKNHVEIFFYLVELDFHLCFFPTFFIVPVRTILSKNRVPHSFFSES